MKTVVFTPWLKVISSFSQLFCSLSHTTCMVKMIIFAMLSITFTPVFGQDPSDIAQTDNAEALFKKLNELVKNRFTGGDDLATGIGEIERILECPSTEVYVYDLEDDETISMVGSVCYSESSSGFADLCSFFGLDASSYTLICVCWKITHLLATSHLHKEDCQEAGEKKCLGKYIRFVDYVEVSAVAFEGGKVEVVADPEKLKAAGVKGEVLDVLDSKLVVSGSSDESGISNSNYVVITKLECTKGCKHKNEATTTGVLYEIGAKATKTVPMGEGTKEVPLKKSDVRRKVVKQANDLLKTFTIKTDLLGWIYSQGNINFLYPLNYNSALSLGAGYCFDLFKGPFATMSYQYRIPVRPFTLNIEPGIGFYSLNSKVTYSGNIMDSIHGGFMPVSYEKDKTISAIPVFLEIGLEKRFGRSLHWGLEACVGTRTFLSEDLPSGESDKYKNVFKATLKDGDKYKAVDECWEKFLKGPGSPFYVKIKLGYFW